jgi:hypothetical protein
MAQILTPDDRQFISRAAFYLENPGFLIRMANLLGQPLEVFARVVPRRVHEVAENALKRTMDLAIRTIPAAEGDDGGTRQAETSSFWSGLRHTLATAATGTAGGLFGLAGLAVELPVSTGLMFRSIARIAGDFGEDLANPETRLECLTIFSYGAPSKVDEGGESSYLTTRLGLAVVVRQAAQFVARSSAEEVAGAVAKGTAAALVRLIAEVAARFNLVVSEKLIAQSVPVVGAVGGGLINAAFSDHFNTVARYHFGLRKLERHYGADAVQEAYRLAAFQRRTGRPQQGAIGHEPR